jgi:hypothetical protein
LIAEILKPAAAPQMDFFASMGPRSIDRGNALDKAFIGSELPASMGPRSIDRGNRAAAGTKPA